MSCFWQQLLNLRSDELAAGTDAGLTDPYFFTLRFRTVTLSMVPMGLDGVSGSRLGSGGVCDRSRVYLCMQLGSFGVCDVCRAFDKEA